MRLMVQRLGARLMRYRALRWFERQLQDMPPREWTWFVGLVIVAGLMIGTALAAWVITAFDIPRGTP